MWKRPINNKASDCSKSRNLWQVVACSQKWFGFGVSLWRLAKCFMVLYHPCAVTSTCLQIRNPTHAQHHHHGEEMTWAWKDAPLLLTSRPQTVDLCTSCSYLVNQGKQCASLSLLTCYTFIFSRFLWALGSPRFVDSSDNCYFLATTYCIFVY